MKRAVIGLQLGHAGGGLGFLCFGGPGSGKSHELRSQMEQCAGRIHQLAIDSEGEYGTLREK